jgi:outer membrane immunogenic protein
MRYLAIAAVAMFMPSISLAADAGGSAEYDWSGYSVGAFGGIAFADVGATELHTSAFGGGWWFPPGPGLPYDFNGDGLLAGVQVGMDRQSGDMVYGLGGEFGVMDLDASIEDPNAPPSPFVDGKPVTSLKGEFYGALTGRLGIAFDRVLLYGRAGLAVLDAEASTIDTCAHGPCGILTIAATNDELLLGLTAGAGVEVALSDRWSAGGEYRYYAFEDMKVSGVASNLLTYSQTVDPKAVHAARLFVNFRF